MRKYARTINNGIFGDFESGNYTENLDDGTIVQHGEASFTGGNTYLGDFFSGNYTHFRPDGQYRLVGDATVYKTFTIPATSGKKGQNLKPDFDFNEIGYGFDKNKPSEILYMSALLPENIMPGTEMYPFCRFIQTEATQTDWAMQYRVYENGSNVSASWTTANTADGIPEYRPYTGGSMLQIAVFEPVLVPSVEDRYSPNMDIKIWRADGGPTSSVLLKAFSIQYQSDRIGLDFLEQEIKQ